jgi:hypothetical protein
MPYAKTHQAKLTLEQLHAELGVKTVGQGSPERWQLTPLVKT